MTLSPNEAVCATASGYSRLSVTMFEVVAGRPPQRLASTAIARRERETNEHSACADERCHVRGTPVEQGCRQGDDSNREAPAAYGGSAVEALCARGSNRHADVIASCDESDTGTDSRNEAADESDCERFDEQCENVADHDHRERNRREVSRSALIDELSARDLHYEMRDEECGRQEADGPKVDAVRVRHDFGGGPHVRNVEADRSTEG
jgi:hypothetical protein